MAVSNPSATAKAQAAAEGIATPVGEHLATETAGAQTESLPGVPADVKAKKVGKRTVEQLGAANTAEEKAAKKARALGEEEASRKAADAEHIEVREAGKVKDVGGESFLVGFPKGSDGTTEVTDAIAAAADDAALKAENPNGVVYREAGTSGDIGGESFVVGR